MSQLKVGVIGGAGRMGQEIFSLLSESEEFLPAVAIDRNQANGFSKTYAELNLSQTGEIQGLIDFSLPELTEKSLDWVRENPVPLVIGTTGLTQQHFDAIEALAEHAPVLWAPNMSIGIALMGEAMKLLAQLQGFDYHITEFHHRHKKDNPSGTALYLKEKLEAALGDSIPQATGVRGGGIYGVHQVFAMSDEEVISFEHQALNRRVFAKGAIRALSWLRQQKPGCYSLADTLNGSQA